MSEVRSSTSVGRKTSYQIGRMLRYDAQEMLKELVQAQEGKAIPYMSQLTDSGGQFIGEAGGYGAYNPYAPGGAISYSRTNTALAQRKVHEHMQTYGGAEPVDWLFTAVNFIAQSTSSAVYHFNDAKGAEQAAVLTVNDPPETVKAPQDLIDLFSQPNPYQNWPELIELLIIDLLIVGNAYWVKWNVTASGKPLAIYRMNPEGVKIVPDQFGPAQYRYRVPGTAQDAIFQPEQVVHFKRPNPHDPLYGMGIVKGGAVAFDTEIALSETMSSYYQRRGMPSGVVRTERRIPKDVFSKLKNQLRNFYTGPANAGQLMVLEAGLTWQDVSPSAADSQFAVMGGESRDRILAMFHLNAKLLGIDTASSTSTVSEWQQLFDSKTMTPLLGKLQKVISASITQPGWGLDFVFDYDEISSPDDVTQRATLLAALPGVKVRELREAAGLNPSTGDNDIDDLVLNLPGQNGDPNTGAGTEADRNLPNEPGQPPLPENTSAITPQRAAGNTRKAKGAIAARAGGNGSASTKALEDGENDWKAFDWENAVGRLHEANVAKGYVHARLPKRDVPFDPDAALAAMDERVEVLDGEIVDEEGKAVDDTNSRTLKRPAQDSLYETRIQSVDDLVASVASDLADAATTLERALLDANEGKAVGRTAYQKLKSSAGWRAFIYRVSEILKTMQENAYTLANVHHTSAGLEPNMDMTPTETVAEDVTDTLQKSLLAKVRKLQQQGANETEYINAIRETVNDWQTGKANVVALTEATRSYNEGTLQIAEANGIESVLVSDGEDDDEPCIDANGQTWTIEEARDNLLEHPNCRRAFVPVS